MVISSFSLAEFFQYLFPLAMIYIINRYFRSYLKFLPSWPLTMAIVLIPTWLVLIYNFGWIIFDFNVLPLSILLSSFALGLHLYDYIRRIDRFFFQAYYLPASELLFLSSTAFLIGLILLRWITLLIL